MKFNIHKIQLDNLLSKIASFPDKKDKDTFKGYIVIEAQNSLLTITADAVQYGLRINDSLMDIQEEGRFFVEWSKFQTAYKPFKKDLITFISDDEYVYIKQKKSQVKVKLGDISGAYKFPEFDGQAKQIEFNSVMLKNAIAKITSTIDENSSKLEISGGLIHVKDNSIRFVGTDLKRLSLIDEKIDYRGNEIKVILHKAMLLEIPKLFSGSITMHFKEDMLLISNANMLFYVRFINAIYPKYETLIPYGDLDFQVPMNRNEVSETIAITMAGGNEARVTINPNEIIFESMAFDTNLVGGRGSIELGKNNLRKELRFGLNLSLLNTFLNVSSEAFVWCFRQEDMRPSMIIDGSYKLILMPIHTND